MKHPLWLAAILITCTAFSQVKEGKVIYNRRMIMYKDMPPEAEQFKAMVLGFTTPKMELLFNGR